MSKNKSDEEILFPDIKIADITVKPWTFGKLFDVSANLESIIDKIESKNLDKSLIGDGDINILDIARVFSLARSDLLSVISITVDKPEKDIKNLSMEDGVKLAYTIFQQNKDTIKNAFAPLIANIIMSKEQVNQEKE